MRIALQNGLLNKKLFIVFFINKKIIYLHKLKKKIMKTLLSLLIIMCFGFTIYAQPGSSGSLVVDRHGKLVGMITAVARGMGHASYGPTFQQLKKYLE